MNKKRPKPLNDLTDSAQGSLRYLLDNLAKIKQTDRLVKHKLPEELKDHCRVINIRDNSIVLAANSAAWATRIKFNLPTLLSQLRADGFAGLSKIELIIQQ